jgi:hypothetical protein
MQAYELHRRAIAVVAKLSIFAGAAGCAGNVVIETDDVDTGETQPGETTSSQPEDTATETADTATETAVTSEPETTCTEASDVAIPCCGAVLQAAFKDDHLYVDPSLATDVEKACCELATATMDTWSGGDPAPFDYQTPYDCCGTGLAAGGWQEHASCAPWGPPMPPAMPPSLRRRIVREAVLA